MKAIFKYFFLLFLFALNYSCNKETKEPEIETSYTKSIERISSNDFEKNLIEIAENTYPARMEVLAAAVFSNIQIPDSAYWYYNSFDGIYIPYAITAGAIDYYSALIDDLNAGRVNSIFVTASFEYKADVEFKNNYSISENEKTGPDLYSEVYVVNMNLKWENYCGSLCAMWISKKRTVVFNQAGELLKVYFDGAEPVAVS
jgi:hypothetical protein